jgi:hypothetical protein
MQTTKRFFTALTLPLALTFMTACAPAQGPTVTTAVTQLPDDPDMEGSPNIDEVKPSPDRTVESLQLNEPSFTAADKAAILAKYKNLDPKKLIDRNLLAKALLYWDANASSFPNKNYLSVVNFSIASKHVRFFNINMKDGSVWAVHVAHGSKSDPNGDGIPEKFSNVDGSNMSSLGVYRASEVYNSTKFKNAMRIDGLSKTNSNARSRAVVLHSAWYVWESDGISPGKTYGCLGLSESIAPKMIENVKNGSMIYAGLATDN